jgi:Tfp pilus assembly protein PilF
MVFKSIGLGITTFFLLGILTGCASTPGAYGDRPAAGELNDDTLDVLFATEFPVESAEEALARASEALQDRDVDKALFFYVRALQFQPENIELLAHIGEIQMQRKNHVLAGRAFRRALGYEPNHARSHEGLGLIYMAEGMHEKAVEELRSAVASDDRLWRAHDALGVYADKAGDHAAAQIHYDKALTVNADAAHVLNNRGYSKYMSGDVQGAMLDLYEAANDRGFPLAWVNLARIYADQGWYDDAIETYKNVMSEAHALNNTGKSAIQNGDFAQARQYLNEAIRLSPTYFPAAEANLLLLDESRLENDS